MTTRNLYEGVLIELNKENAPNILLEDFNYFVNKAINNYINKRYNIYDINQQTTDDLRVLKATAMLDPEQVTIYNGLTMAGDGKNATYEVIMPSDYLHILNCICIYKVKKTYKCYNAGDTWRAAATRLTADMYSLVLDNFWNKPTYKRPYYYIHNVNKNIDIPTNPWEEVTGKTGRSAYMKGTDSANFESTHDRNKVFTDNGYTDADDTPLNIGYDKDARNNQIVQGEDNPAYILIGDKKYSTVERGLNIRYGNVSLVRLEIRYGTDNSVFELYKVYIDYIKAPQHIRLTQEEIDRTEDVSQILEYPDYVCQEIINELVHLVMENISDLRLLTHPVVTLSIANPAQQLTEPVAQPQQ